MISVKRFLRVLEKFGYPNPRLVQLANMSSYKLNSFVHDLIEEIGVEATETFIKNALSKLSEDDKGIKVDVEYGFCYVIPTFKKITDYEFVDLDISFGQSSLLSTDENGDEAYMSLEEINDNLGLGEMSDFDELIEYIRTVFISMVYNNCGFAVFISEII